jgi:hypothetical protein
MSDIDFNLVKIFVEGSTDQAFLQFVLEKKFNISFSNQKAWDDAIIDCKGKGNLADKLRIADTPLRIAEGGFNLILFDADSGRNQGGFARRQRELQSIIGNFRVPSYLFLFPDNQQDGDLEEFYCSCFPKDMAFFSDCWDDMIECIKNNNPGLQLNLPYAAEKVFSYVDLFKEYKSEAYKNSKTKRSYFDEQLWQYDFEGNPYLRGCRSF